MGLRLAARYTVDMTSDPPPRLKTGDLIIDPERGEIRSSRGESTRLGLVNMRVLMLLLSRSGHVVSRAEIFDSVWRNQIVGDDTLTRAISDIRAEVGRLSAHGELIETLRKRGYRWTAAVEPVAPHADAARQPPADRPPVEIRPVDVAPANIAPANIAPANIAPAEPEAKTAGRRPLIVWGRRSAVYAAALLLTASLAVWLMSETVRPGRQIVAVLPTTMALAQPELALVIEQQLSDYLIGLDRVDVLSRSATDSRPRNPFPYFYYEFGASWLVESELRNLSPAKTELTIAVVDARTGIVLLRSALTFTDDGSPSAAAFDPAFSALEDFFAAQTDR